MRFVKVETDEGIIYGKVSILQLILCFLSICFYQDNQKWRYITVRPLSNQKFYKNYDKLMVHISNINFMHPLEILPIIN